MSITDKVLRYAATLQYCTFWLGLKGCREWSWWIAGNGHFHKTKRCSKLLLVRWRWEMMGWRFYTIVRGLCCEQVVRLSDTFRFWASYLFLFSRNEVMGEQWRLECQLAQAGRAHHLHQNGKKLPLSECLSHLASVKLSLQRRLDLSICRCSCSLSSTLTHWIHSS